MNTVRRLKKAVLSAALLPLLVWGTGVKAEYVLSAPPRETPEAGATLYGDLAVFLSKVLGEKVVYEHPGDWATYARKMREGHYDILFDAPHFAAWRIEKQHAQPLVRLPGMINFVVVAHTSDTHVTSPDDLVGRQVCLLPSPSLGAVSVYALYSNPMRQPKFVDLTGSYVDVAKAVQSGRCFAGVVRKNDYLTLLTPETRDDIKVIAETITLTNQGITVGEHINEQARERMLKALTSPPGLKAAAPILERFSKQSRTLLPASVADYEGQDLLTQNMMFGW